MSAEQAALHWLCPSCDYEPAEDSIDPICPACGARLIRLGTKGEDLSGVVIDGRFEVRDLLGEGGMGSVYRAWQRSIGREVAIKLIDKRHSRDPMAVRRFLREARLASQLSQPNTVSVFDFGQGEDGRLFIAMELIRGRTLAAVLEADGPFSVARAAWIGVQLCDALDAAHRLHIVHRDLKPANVVVLDDPPGRDLVKVLDFGLAKSLRDQETQATDTGLVVGTPRYMAPEVVMGERPSPQSDLYAVGVILGELTTGKQLWDASSFPALAGQKMQGTPILNEIPSGIRGVVEKLLWPELARRPATASVVRGLLRPLVIDSETPVLRTGPARAIDGSAPTHVGDAASADAVETVPMMAAGGGAAGAGARVLESAELDAPTLPATPTPLPEIAMPGRRRGSGSGSGSAAGSAAGAGSGSAAAAAAGTAAAAAPSVATSAVRPTPGRRIAIGIAAIAVLFAIVVAVVMIASGGRKHDRAPRGGSDETRGAASVDAASVASAPVDAAVIESAVIDARREIVLHVTSRPSGAAIVVDGVARGAAPIDVRVTAGDQAIAIEATRRGKTVREMVVPDQDRPVELVMPREATPTPGHGKLPF